MDAKTINAIRDYQAKLNVECTGNGMEIITPSRIIVQEFNDIEAIAEIIYGDKAHLHVRAEFEDDWTYASVDSPEGVHFFYEKMDIGLTNNLANEVIFVDEVAKECS